MFGSGTVSRKRARPYSSGGYYVNRPFKRPRRKVYIRSPAARAAMVKKSFNSESNYVDVAATNYVLNTLGNVQLINTIPQGASVNERIGKKAVLTSLNLKGYLFNDALAVYNDIAVLIVYDRRPTGALPAVTDILDTAHSVSFNKDDNSSRFRIIRRFEDMLVGGSSGTLTESTYKAFDHYIPLRSLPVVYKSAGTGAIGDIEQGALYLVTVGNTAAGNTDATLYTGMRLRFKDT